MPKKASKKSNKKMPPWMKEEKMEYGKKRGGKKKGY